MSPHRILPDERSCPSRLWSRDRAAFDDFYEVSFRRVFSFALNRTEDRVTAEWVTEATLSEALERLGELHGGEVSPAWLLGILKEKLAVACDPPRVVELPPRRRSGRLVGAWRRLGQSLPWPGRRAADKPSEEALR